MLFSGILNFTVGILISPESAPSFFSFRVVIESEDFLDVPLSILQQFLSDNAINIKREEQIFTAGLKWLKHDESRSVHGFEVLNCVRLARVAPRFLLDMVEVEEIFDNEKCRQVINQAKVCKNLYNELYPTNCKGLVTKVTSFFISRNILCCHLKSESKKNAYWPLLEIPPVFRRFLLLLVEFVTIKN